MTAIKIVAGVRKTHPDADCFASRFIFSSISLESLPFLRFNDNEERKLAPRYLILFITMIAYD